VKKKLIVLSSISVALISGAIATAVMIPKGDPVKEAATVSEPVQELPKQEVINEPAVVAETPQKAPKAVVAAVPTVDELAIEYGWSGEEAVAGFVAMWPQHFTEQNRRAAFQYMHDVGVALAIKAGTDPSKIADSTANGAFRTYLMSSNNYKASDRPAAWVNVGKMAGVDTSRYE